MASRFIRSSRGGFRFVHTGTDNVALEVETPSAVKRYVCNKRILATHSDVFEAMFFDSPEEIDEIRIEGVEEDVFESVLRYLYTDCLKISCIKEAIEIYLIAYQFNFRRLMNLCRKFMKHGIEIKNIFEIYQLALCTNDKRLRKTCEISIRSRFFEVIKSEGFVEASPHVVKCLLQQRNLEGVKEVFLFEEILKWVIAQCGRQKLKLDAKNLRKISLPLLSYIYFLAMTQEEFVNGPAASGILHLEEVASIIMNTILPYSIPLPFWCSEERRENKVLELHHTCRIDYNRVDTCSIESKLRLTGMSISLIGVSVCVTLAKCLETTVSVFCENRLLSTHSKMRCVKEEKLKVYLSQPCVIHPDTDYRIEVAWKGHVALCVDDVPEEYCITKENTTFVISLAHLYNSHGFRPHFQELIYKTL